MPKNKRISQPPAPTKVLTTWLVSFLSIGLLLLAGKAFINDIGSFQSCGHNTALKVSSCGKAAPNPGDLVLFLLFLLAAGLTLSLFTMAWRLTRRKKV